MSKSIHIIPSAEIDVSKWNDCIDKNNNGLIYSSFEYLNFLADNWHGLIIGDYESVMALPWRKKWGIRYIYTPPFMQQLGLVGNTAIDPSIILNELQQFCKYITYNFNFDNQYINNSFSTHTNLIIPLSQSAGEIKQQYAKSLERNLQKAINSGLKIVEGEYQRSLQWYKQYQGDKIPHVKDVDYQQLLQLMAYLQQKGQLICNDALNKQGEIIATNVYIKDAKRIYHLLPSSTKEGKKLAAMHYLIDNEITKNAGSNYVFDFEGSDIKGVQQFYLQFGAIPQPYFRLHQNNLPFWLKLIKK